MVLQIVAGQTGRGSAGQHAGIAWTVAEGGDLARHADRADNQDVRVLGEVPGDIGRLGNTVIAGGQDENRLVGDGRDARGGEDRVPAGRRARPGSPSEALTIDAPFRPVTSLVRAMTPVVISVQLVVPVASKGL